MHAGEWRVAGVSQNACQLAGYLAAILVESKEEQTLLPLGLASWQQ